MYQDDSNGENTFEIIDKKMDDSLGDKTGNNQEVIVCKHKHWNDSCAVVII